MTELAEVLGLRARWLTRLPAPTTLVCAAHDALGDARGFWITTSRPHWQSAHAGGYPALNGHAWACLVDAADRDAAALAVEQWLVPTPPWGVPPAWVITGNVYGLLGSGLSPRDPVAMLADGCKLTVGDVVEHFRAELVALDPVLTGGAAPRPEGLL